MKKTVALVALAGLLCLGGSAMGAIGTADVVPAATLLVPYFEVDLSSSGGATTLFSINNASDESVLAHVTLWTEFWIPIIDFDVYLTGYDVQTFNVRDILNGVLPQTGSINTLSNRGPFSGPHVTFPNCSNTEGPTNYGPLPAGAVNLLQQAFSGQPISLLGGLCASAAGHPTLARGYATIDSVSECSQEFPSSAGYFVDGGGGIANNNNVLWGDYFLVDPENNFAQGFTQVHIEADSTALLGGNGSCDPTDGFPYTFYCSLAPGIPGADNREALASVYGVRYLQGGAFTGGTDIIAWRDPLTGANSPVTCGMSPFPPAGQTQIVAFDEEENTQIQAGGPSLPDVPIDLTPFPWCTNKASVAETIDPNFDFGWLYLNLNQPFAGALTFNQAYVQVIMSAEGRFSVGLDGVQLNGLTAGDGREPNPSLGPGLVPPTLTDSPSLVQATGTGGGMM